GRGSPFPARWPPPPRARSPAASEMTTSDAPKPPAQVPGLPGEPPAAPPAGDRLAADLRGFGPLGIVAMLVIVLAGYVSVGNVVVPLGAALALVWTRWSRTPWREIGYVRPASWTCTLAVRLAFRVALPL